MSRGGFYWHFDDRSALLDEMLDAWERVGVDEVIEFVDREGGDERTKLRRLSAIAYSGEAQGRPFSLPFSGEELLRIDLAVRDWSRREPRIAERLRKVDNRRMDYMRSLISAFCPNDDEVEVRCMLAYSLWVGNHFIAAEHDGRKRTYILELALRQLVA